MKLTRREMAAAVVSAAAITGTSSGAEQQPAALADEIQAARERLKANCDQVSQLAVPMATEPAFHFKA